MDFFAAIGIAVIVFALVAVIVFWSVGIYDLINKCIHRNYQRGYEEGRESIRSQFHSDSWWFSEDDATMNLIKGLSKQQSVSFLRDQWRKERKTEVKVLDNGNS